MRLIATILTSCFVAMASMSAQDASELVPARQGIAVIGASASAGWGVMVPVLEPSEGNRYRHVTLANALAAVDPTLPAVVTRSGDPLFFRQRASERAVQVDLAIAAKPEAVIAVDFLFWYGYGTVRANTPSDAARMRMDRLALGLAQIDRLAAENIPIIVGNLPDVSDAADAMLYSVIGDAQLPRPDVLIDLNNRIAQWAQANDRIHILPLSTLINDMRGGKGVTAGGATWGPEPRLMQHDHLHPTDEGLLAVAASAVDRVRAAQGEPIPRPPVDKVAARLRLRQGDVAPQGDTTMNTPPRSTNTGAP